MHMLRNAIFVRLAVHSSHSKETITKTRESRAETQLTTGTVCSYRSTEPQEVPANRMLFPSLLRRAVFMISILSVIGLLSVDPIRADQESGTAIPAESRPCVDCHAFEFMQRALQDLKKTAYNLDMRTETLLLQVEKRNLCDCVTANMLN
ncbi:PREDICTED: neuropeptide-like protein C4orf48 homolog isoform X2 [Crocodylus porosus]|uniref:neuropeptide-like protein C4orf48 homolog isoform X2 n=1 Tax=Crocodylus porosus TaxID=8502 RepID=UPI00093A9619|nr:PREDICTED: neuropeptide-like protein C4orf48 homolog isoform X2 [Crocodylus porosus]